MDTLRSLTLRTAVALRLLRDGENGQAMVEYALLLSLVAIVSIAILSTLGGNVSSVFSEINQDF